MATAPPQSVDQAVDVEVTFLNGDTKTLRDCATIFDVKTDVAAHLNNFFPYIVVTDSTGKVLEDNNSAPPPRVSAISLPNLQSDYKDICSPNGDTHVIIRHALRGDFDVSIRARLCKNQKLFEKENHEKATKLLRQCFYAHAIEEEDSITEDCPKDIRRWINARIHDRANFESIAVCLIEANADPDVYCMQRGDVPSYYNPMRLPLRANRTNRSLLLWSAKRKYLAVLTTLLQSVSNAPFPDNIWYNLDTLTKTEEFLPHNKLVIAHKKHLEHLAAHLSGDAEAVPKSKLPRYKSSHRVHGSNVVGKQPYDITESDGTTSTASTASLPLEKNESLFSAAISSNDETLIKTLLESRPRVALRSRNNLKETPIMIAATLRKHKLVQLMINTDNTNVNDIDENGRSALCRAVENNDHEMVLLLVKARADPGEETVPIESTDSSKNRIYGVSETILARAVSRADQDVVQTLIGAQANVSTTASKVKSALYVAVETNKLDLLKQLASHAKIDGASFVLAVCLGNVDLVSWMIASHADVNALGWHGKPALFSAVEKNHREIITMLLSAKADPRWNPKLTQSCGSLITTAVKHKEVDLVRLLLSSTANVNAVGFDGKPALITAIENEVSREPEGQSRDPSQSIFYSLLDARAAVEVKFNDHTPLTTAVGNGQHEFAEALIRLRANVNYRDCIDRIPLIVAVKNDQNALALALIKAHADVNVNEEKDCLTPLIFSCVEKKQNELVVAMIDARCDVNAIKDDSDVKENNVRYSILMFAIGHEMVDCAKILIRERADVNAVDVHGQTPLALARHLENEDLIDALILHGAQMPPSCEDVDSIEKSLKDIIDPSDETDRSHQESMSNSSGDSLDSDSMDEFDYGYPPPYDYGW